MMKSGSLAIHGGQPVRTKPFPEWPIFDETEEKLLLEVFRSGKWGGTGRIKLPAFEQQFANLHGAKHAVSVANGTVAITLALQAAGIQPGDEVIMPSYTFIATATATLLLGAIPVFVDVEEETLLLNPELVEEAITPKTKGIVAVHIAGAPANMTRLREIADKHGLVLMEDAAQAVGASWEGRGVGTLGDVATFSLQSSKNINAGEGGVILTNSDRIADMAWSLSNCGRIKNGAWYQHEHVGWNFRMTEFQAAIGLGQLSRLGQQNETRERNAARLSELLSVIPGIVTVKRDPRITTHAYHLYMFKLDPALAARIEKSDFMEKLTAEGVHANPGYIPLHLNEAILNDSAKRSGTRQTYSCPVTERMCTREVIWLHQNLLLGTEADVDDIARAIAKVADSYA
ncbi:DegT/DnrJ/EryC1/StrS family aminotransferase [Paenibacillus oceani]|nr:DegT/DnrJ/EryC1/StrS family aminotransferase [Paenibacillus oceani]